MRALAETSSRVFVVWFRNLTRWDVKNYSARLSSSFPFVELGEFVKQRSERIRPYDQPDEMFRILGVSNEHGVFHAYDTLGKTINQPYQRVMSDDFFYNPYRVNVGSIGLVPPNLGGNYVSPAYVVFSVDQSRCDQRYLELVMRSDWFNPTLRAQTAGSVRQNLTFDLLCKLQIPLPPLPVQRKIVAEWEASRKKAAATAAQIEQLERDIEARFLADLGLKGPKQAELPKCFAVRWKNLLRWSVGHIRMASASVDLSVGKYAAVPLRECLVDTMHGYCIKPVTVPSPHKMLKLSALRAAGLDLSESKYIKVPDKIAKRFHLYKGDLLICRSVGSFDHIAKCALVESEEPSILFPDIIIRARFNAKMIPEYAREFIQTKPGKTYFQQNARTAVGMWKIGGADIANLPIPLPPLSIQRKIVERVAKRRDEIARLKADAKAAADAAKTDVEAMILGTTSVERREAESKDAGHA